MLLWRRSNRRTASPRKVAAVVLLAGAAAYGLRFAVGWILDGIAHLMWFIEALPQALIWFTLLAVLVAVSLRLVPATRQRVSGAPPRSEPPRSDLIELADNIRQAEFSPHARWVLRQRLGQAAASVRARRDAFPFRQVWEDIQEGRWPADPDLRAILHPERGRARLVPHRGFAQQLERALDALWSYGRGGGFDGS